MKRDVFSATKGVLDFEGAAERLMGVVVNTPLCLNQNLSRKYGCNVYLKREDMQIVRSYKIRGAYNLMSTIPTEHLSKGVVCSSAGNHAQGVAYSCKLLKAKGVIYMPITTPKQKVTRTKMFGEDFIDIVLSGDTFDECNSAAIEFSQANQFCFIPPFDHLKVIEGQSTVGYEIFNQIANLDFLFLPVGGGGLAAGTGSFYKNYSPNTFLIGAEPEGAPSMIQALRNGGPVMLAHIDRFVDGAAVKRVGDITYPMCQAVLDDMLIVPEGRVCSKIMQLYNEDAIVVEPAGALSVAALDSYKEQIKRKNVVCVISGGNNDIERMQEIRERSLLYEGLRHYLLISLAQRPGSIKEFIDKSLSPTDNIICMEYLQKNTRSYGPILFGIDVQKVEDYPLLLERLKQQSIRFTELSNNDQLLDYLV